MRYVWLCLYTTGWKVLQEIDKVDMSLMVNVLLSRAKANVNIIRYLYEGLIPGCSLKHVAMNMSSNRKASNAILHLYT